MIFCDDILYIIKIVSLSSSIYTKTYSFRRMGDNTADERKGLYVATSALRMMLNNAPRFFGDTTPTGKMVEWAAPLLSNMVGMAVNLNMRKGLTKTKEWSQEMEERMVLVESKLQITKRQ